MLGEESKSKQNSEDLKQQSKGKETKSVPKQSAFEATVKYLALAPRSEKEVRSKLYQKGYPKSEVEEAIQRAIGYHYIDDEKYVLNYVEYYGAKYGRRLLEYKLVTEKGISQAMAKAILDEKISSNNEQEKALLSAKKHAANKRISNKKDMQKVAAFLYRRGYEKEVIDSVIDEIMRELPEEFGDV